MGFIGFDAHIPSTSSLWFPGLARKKSEKPRGKSVSSDHLLHLPGHGWWSWSTDTDTKDQSLWFWSFWRYIYIIMCIYMHSYIMLYICILYIYIHIPTSHFSHQHENPIACWVRSTTHRSRLSGPTHDLLGYRTKSSKTSISKNMVI